MTRNPDASRACPEKTGDEKTGDENAGGRSFEPMRMGDDSGGDLLAPKSGVPIAGGMTPCARMSDLPPHWFVRVEVEEVDGKAVATETAVGTGRIARATVPSGRPSGRSRRRAHPAPDIGLQSGNAPVRLRVKAIWAAGARARGLATHPQTALDMT